MALALPLKTRREKKKTAHFRMSLMKLKIINYDFCICLTLCDKIRILPKALGKGTSTPQVPLTQKEGLTDCGYYSLETQEDTFFFKTEPSKLDISRKTMDSLDANNKTQSFKLMLDFGNIHCCVTTSQILKIFLVTPRDVTKS